MNQTKNQNSIHNLQVSKRLYSGLNLIIIVKHCAIKIERLFLELKVRILKFIFLRSSGKGKLPVICLWKKATSPNNLLGTNYSKLSSTAKIPSGTSTRPNLYVLILKIRRFKPRFGGIRFQSSPRVTRLFDLCVE